MPNNSNNEDCLNVRFIDLAKSFHCVFLFIQLERIKMGKSNFDNF